MKYLVDSDYVADYLKGRTLATDLLNSLLQNGIAISIITFAEVYEGIYYGHNRTHLHQYLPTVSPRGHCFRDYPLDCQTVCIHAW